MVVHHGQALQQLPAAMLGPSSLAPEKCVPQ
eukprot:CAMPEP_0175160184 /NCGR_PEP_ID=MMETSP0087-20121206/23867_1 /TAXON_ID=136419 /ORGANISM="Unknown Unknown, Strain D1" /LENGTH=30 /DNA_ID= /DNA_START= /DNA_END= /DNA_ORIENTATION=